MTPAIFRVQSYEEWIRHTFFDLFIREKTHFGIIEKHIVELRASGELVFQPFNIAPCRKLVPKNDRGKYDQCKKVLALFAQGYIPLLRLLLGGESSSLVGSQLIVADTPQIVLEPDRAFSEGESFTLQKIRDLGISSGNLRRNVFVARQSRLKSFEAGIDSPTEKTNSAQRTPKFRVSKKHL